MSTKAQRAYFEILRLLPDCPNLLYFISDFERAEFNALAWKFQYAKVSNLELFFINFVQHFGCHAHFARALVAHFNSAGYSRKEYKSSPILKASLRLLLTLPFSHKEDVHEVYTAMRNQICNFFYFVFNNF